MPVNVHIPTAWLQQLVPITGSRKGAQDGENESKTLIITLFAKHKDNLIRTTACREKNPAR